MNRIAPVDPTQAEGPARTLLDGVKAKLGVVPNLFRVLAHSPAALDGYLTLGGTLTAGRFDAALREQIALTVAESNACEYCLSAHTFIGRKAGLSDQAVRDARTARGQDGRTDAILKLAQAIVAGRGVLDDADVARARAAGLADEDILETVANVVQNIFSNYVNHLAATPIDFPAVEPVAHAPAVATPA